MMKKPVKVWAIFRWDNDCNTAEMEYLCASEIMARKVLEQIRIKEDSGGVYYNDGMALEVHGVFYEIEQEPVWSEDPKENTLGEEIIRKARS